MIAVDDLQVKLGADWAEAVAAGGEGIAEAGRRSARLVIWGRG